MDWIEQRNQDVHVQEGDHEALLLVPQPIHQLHAHRALAWTLREQWDPVADDGWGGVGRRQGLTGEFG